MPIVNERFTARVRDIASDGSGVVEHPSGRVFFVPGVWLQELAEFRITSFKKRFGYAELVSLIEPSASRLTPPCPHHGFNKTGCGGCPWQFIGYESQLAAKQERVRKTLNRMGLEEKVKPIWGSPLQFGYRNRAQLKSDGKNIGFVARGANRLAPVKDCLVLSDHNRATLRELAASLPNAKFRPKGKAHWITLDIDEDVSVGSLSINRRRPFRQGNSEQNRQMKTWLNDSLAKNNRRVPVMELFAGSGNFTEVLSNGGFRQVLAVEVAPEAVKLLAQKQLPGVSAVTADLFSETGVEKVARLLPLAELLVLDPPREGFPNIKLLLQHCRQLQAVRYISCDPATFARDLQAFIEQGFHVDEVQPVDMFPHTPHIELLASLVRP